MDAFSEASEISASAEDEAEGDSRSDPSPPPMPAPLSSGELAFNEQKATVPAKLRSGAAVRVTAFTADSSGVKRVGNEDYLSSSVLIEVGPVRVLVDCPLDFEGLIDEPPLGFHQLSAESDSDACMRLKSFFAPLKTHATGVGLRASFLKLRRALRVEGSIDSDSSSSLQIHAILATNPLGLLGVPLLLRELARNKVAPPPLVLATKPVAAAACAAIQFLDSEEGGRVYDKADETDEAEEAEGVAQTEDPTPRRQVSLLTSGDRSALLDFALGCVKYTKDKSDRPLSTEAKSRHGRAVVDFQSRLILCNFGERICIGSGDEGGRSRLVVSPVSSGFCLGGSNWSLFSGGEFRPLREVFVVGPSCGAGLVEGQRAGVSGVGFEKGESKSKLSSSSLFTTRLLTRRLPLAADWSPLSRTPLVVFFETAVKAKSEGSFSSRGGVASSGGGVASSLAKEEAAERPAFATGAAECTDTERSSFDASSPCLVGKVVSAALKNGLSVLIPVDCCGVLLSELLCVVRNLVALCSLNVVPVLVVGFHLGNVLRAWQEEVEASDAPPGLDTSDGSGGSSENASSTTAPFDFTGLLARREVFVVDRLEDVPPQMGSFQSGGPCVVFASSVFLRIGPASALLRLWRKSEDKLILLADPGGACETPTLRMPFAEEQRFLRRQVDYFLTRALAMTDCQSKECAGGEWSFGPSNEVSLKLLEIDKHLAKETESLAREEATRLCGSRLLWPALFDDEFVSGCFLKRREGGALQSEEERRDSLFRMRVARVPVDIRLTQFQLNSLLARLAKSQTALLVLPPGCERQIKKGEENGISAVCTFLFSGETVEASLESKASSDDASKLATLFYDFRLQVDTESLAAASQCMTPSVEREELSEKHPTLFVAPLAMGSTAHLGSGEAFARTRRCDTEGRGDLNAASREGAEGASKEVIFFGRLSPEALKLQLAEVGVLDAQVRPSSSETESSQTDWRSCSCCERKGVKAAPSPRRVIVDVPSLSASVSLFGCCRVVEINAKSASARAILLQAVKMQLFSVSEEAVVVGSSAPQPPPRPLPPPTRQTTDAPRPFGKNVQSVRQ